MTGKSNNRKRVSLCKRFVDFLVNITGIDADRLATCNAQARDAAYADVMRAATGHKSLSSAVGTAIRYGLAHQKYILDNIVYLYTDGYLPDQEKWDVYIDADCAARLTKLTQTINTSLDTDYTDIDAIRMCCCAYLLHAPTGDPTRAETINSRHALRPYMDALSQPLAATCANNHRHARALTPFSQPGTKVSPHFFRPIADMIDATKRSKIDSYVDCCAGAGAIRSQIACVRSELALRKHYPCLLNDLDNRKVNVFKTISKHPTEMKTILKAIVGTLCNTPATDNNSHIITAELQKTAYLRICKKAVRFMLKNVGSGFGTQKSTNAERRKQIINKLQAILDDWQLFARMFTDCTFSNLDMFELIENSDDFVKRLLWIDPPYARTGAYADNITDFSSHKKLADLLHASNDIFVLFFRISPARAQKKTENGLWRDWETELLLTGFYRAQYSGHHYYYYDVSLRNGANGCCIERVLCSSRMARYRGWKELK